MNRYFYATFAILSVSGCGTGKSSLADMQAACKGYVKASNACYKEHEEESGDDVRAWIIGDSYCAQLDDPNPDCGDPSTWYFDCLTSQYDQDCTDEATFRGIDINLCQID